MHNGTHTRQRGSHSAVHEGLGIVRVDHVDRMVLQQSAHPQERQAIHNGRIVVQQMNRNFKVPLESLGKGACIPETEHRDRKPITIQRTTEGVHHSRKPSGMQIVRDLQHPDPLPSQRR
jgi:hypothetical protein